MREPTFSDFQHLQYRGMMVHGSLMEEKCGLPMAASMMMGPLPTSFGFTLEPERMLKVEAQLSTFLVENGMPGYSVGQKIIDKTGMRASNTAELVFEDCIVPPENLVGEVGDSMIHMMGNLEIERLTLAAMSLGIARRSLDEMNKYATDREAFEDKSETLVKFRGMLVNHGQNTEQCVLTSTTQQIT